MTDRRPKIAALVADAFQEEEYFFPKVALNEAVHPAIRDTPSKKLSGR